MPNPVFFSTLLYRFQEAAEVPLFWTFDPRYLDGSHSLSLDNTTVTNDTAGFERNVVATRQTLTADDTNIYYWEFAAIAGDGSVAGQFGVINALNPPVYATGDIGDVDGLGRGLNSLSVGGGTSTFSLQSWGNPDILMVAFQPSTGQMWTGVNGTWDHDPDVDAATATAVADVTYWKVAANSYDANLSVTLVSEAANFTHTVPVACTPLEDAPQNTDLQVESQTVAVIEQPNPIGQLGIRGQKIIVITEE